jgi:hypothetical protein
MEHRSRGKRTTSGSGFGTIGISLLKHLELKSSRIHSPNPPHHHPLLSHPPNVKLMLLQTTAYTLHNGLPLCRLETAPTRNGHPHRTRPDGRNNAIACRATTRCSIGSESGAGEVAR